MTIFAVAGYLTYLGLFSAYNKEECLFNINIGALNKSCNACYME